MIRLALYSYAFSLPFAYLWDVMFGVSTQLKPYRVAGMAVIGLFLLAQTGRGTRLRLDSYDKTFLALYGLGALLALFWWAVDGVEMHNVPHMLLLVGSAFLPYLVIKNAGLSQRLLERLLRTYVIGVCASVVLAIELGISLTNGRFVAFLDNPNRLAFALAVSFHFLLGKTVFGRRTKVFKYLVRGVAVTGLAIALIFTGSRAAILATALSLCVYAIPLLHRSSAARAARFRRAATLLPLALLAGGILSAVYDTYREESTAIRRYEATGESGYSGRLDLWRAAWNVTVDHYFIGVGTGQYREYHREYMAKLDHLYSPRLADKDLMVHSDYLEMLTSAGAVGLLLFVGMLVSIYRRLAKRSRSLTHAQTSLPAIALPLFVLMLTFGAFHTQVYDPQYFFVMAIIMLTAGARPQKRLAAPTLKQPLTAST